MNHIILTGMHRSGTSATGRILHENGYKMGDNLIGKNSSNIYGHFEEREFMNLHKNFMKKYYKLSYKPWLIENNKKLSSYNPNDKSLAKQLWYKFIRNKCFGFKDPRTCLFLDLWKEIIPYIKFIICLRHPYNVYLSIIKRNNLTKEFNKSNPEVILNNWYYHNKFVFDCIKLYGIKDFLLLDIDKEFSDPESLKMKLENFIDFKLHDVFGKIDKNVFTEIVLKTDKEKILFSEYFPKIYFLYNSLTNLANSGIIIDEKNNEFLDKGNIFQFEEALLKLKL